MGSFNSTLEIFIEQSLGSRLDQFEEILHPRTCPPPTTWPPGTPIFLDKWQKLITAKCRLSLPDKPKHKHSGLPLSIGPKRIFEIWIFPPSNLIMGDPVYYGEL